MVREPERVSSGGAVQSMATSDAAAIEIRGYDLCGEIIGQRGFVELFYLELVGRWPTKPEAAVLDACLVILTEHGITPSTIAVRMTIHGAPDAVQGAVAAGVLGAGARYLGALDGCCEMLSSIEDGGASASKVVEEMLKGGGRVPGLGHPIHRDEDPRTSALLDVMRENRLDMKYWSAMQSVAQATQAMTGRRLPVNAEGALSSALLSIAIPLTVVRGVAAVARAAGSLGHIADEFAHPTGGHIWHAVETAIDYQRP